MAALICVLLLISAVSLGVSGFTTPTPTGALSTRRIWHYQPNVKGTAQTRSLTVKQTIPRNSQTLCSNTVSRLLLPTLSLQPPPRLSALWASSTPSSPDNSSAGQPTPSSWLTTQRRTLFRTVALLTTVIALVAVLSTTTNTSPGALMVNLRTWLRSWLSNLNDAGSKGLALYAVLFTLWTMTVGVTTPVETAAGFAFGTRKAILANTVGKFGGAVLAYLLGRFICYNRVNDYFRTLKQKEQARLQQDATTAGNKKSKKKVKKKSSKMVSLFMLVEESVQERPLPTALLVRFCPFPEFVKNVGVGVLDIKNRYYYLSLILHGLPFTCLWSTLGAETAQVALHGAAPSQMLKAMVSFSTWFGFFVSPTLIGWYVRFLRGKQNEKQTLSQQTGTSPDDNTRGTSP